jgi:membrane protein DedA with SNARE-associated domain
MIHEALHCLLNNSDKLTCLAPYAYEPMGVYLFLVVMMLLSAVGFPIPEEVTLVSIGILAYMGANPDKFPPPFSGAPFVHPKTAAIVAFLAVLLSDVLIFSIGRFFGPKVFKWNLVKRFISDESRQRIEQWTRKYGSWACGLFRFTPGIRFPGHLACGMVGFPVWKFIVIDGIAALISVPTQILIIAHYGEDILGILRKFKFVLLLLFIVIGVIYWVRRRKEIKELHTKL